MTLQQMVQDINDNLTLAGVAAPSPARAINLLNQSKDRLVAELNLLDAPFMIARATLTWAATDTYKELPTDCERVKGLTRTDTGSDQECSFIDVTEREQFQPDPWIASGGSFGGLTSTLCFYLEGSRIYTAGRNGTGQAMTTVLRYQVRVADLTAADMSSEYAYIPPMWHTIITSDATAQAIPMNNPEYGKYSQQTNQLLAQMRRSIPRRVKDGPAYVRWVF